jgi:transposase
MIGLPSLRALDGAHGTRIWLATEATDMHCGIDRLAERVRTSHVVATKDTIMPLTD